MIDSFIVIGATQQKGRKREAIELNAFGDQQWKKIKDKWEEKK